jgi:pyrroloquinoline quinone (PQQ) biosynthesis protein C
MQPLHSPARDDANKDDATSRRPLKPERFVEVLAAVVFGDPARGVAPSPALRNRFLVAFAQGEFTRTQLIAYGIQHYQLVNNFTCYLEHALVCAPTRSVDDWRVKSFIAENLYEEYGEAVRGEDHPSLYRRFLRSAGITEVLGLDAMLPDEELAHTLERDLVLFRETEEFIDQHIRMAASFLSALGAVGPGHEWAIPVMFLPLIEGLKRYQQRHQLSLDTTYFTLHVGADEKHGELLRNALVLNARSKVDQERIRMAAERSLALRARFWEALYDRVLSSERPEIGKR